MSNDPIHQALSEARLDQQPVSLHLAQGAVRGTVVQLSDEVVELRDGAERVLVRIARIDALRR